ncbi:MAG: hypothetical protein KJ058_07780 [Thermoanaerobaculia bacterium]|nr:hypothetical protein [Thermoanaerobaculia bacterium]
MRLRALSLAALLCLPAGGAAVAQSRLLGDGATLYQAHSLRRGDIFPGYEGIPAEAQILVLEVSRAAGGGDFWLVPGTEDLAAETVVQLFPRDGGAGVLLAWQSADPARRDRLQLRGFDRAGWTEPAEIELPWLLAGAPAPRFAITTDTVRTVDADGAAVASRRDVVHCFWWGTADGSPTLLYRAAFVVDGRAITLSAALDLGVLDTESAISTPAPDLVLSSLALRAQGEASRVAVAFLGARSGRFLTFDLQVLPDELVDLADRARGHIIDLGATLYPGDIVLLAEAARAEIQAMAAALHPAAAAHAANGTRDLIAAEDGSLPLDTLAGKARGHIIDLVSAPVRGGVAREAPSARSLLLEALQAEGNEPGAHLLHSVKVRAVGSWVLPPVASAPLITRVASEADLLTVAWRSAEHELSYFELGLPVQLEPRRLPLERVSLEEALALLEQRLADR